MVSCGFGETARLHHAPGSLKCQIQDRSEVDIESQRSAVLAHDLSVPAEQLSILGVEYLRCRRRRSQRIAKAIDGSPFPINACEQRRGNTLLTFAQQTPCLFRTPDVPREENYSLRLQPRQQGSDPRRYLRAVEADDQ